MSFDIVAGTKKSGNGRIIEDKWTTLEYIGLVCFAVYGVVVYFFVHDNIILFRVSGGAMVVAHAYSLTKAANEKSGVQALAISFFFFALSVVLKFPVAFD